MAETSRRGRNQPIVQSAVMTAKDNLVDLNGNNRIYRRTVVCFRRTVLLNVGCRGGRAGPPALQPVAFTVFKSIINNRYFRHWAAFPVCWRFATRQRSIRTNRQGPLRDAMSA